MNKHQGSFFRRWKHRFIGLTGALLFCLPAQAFSQSTELTSRDNHALLYAHQLGFTSSGAPSVRIRIADGLEKLRFVPQGDFRVMPAGNGGAVIELKGGRVYEVTLKNAQPGHYQHGVIIGRAESVEALADSRSECVARGFECEIVPIGSVFALRGNVFDNRENILMTRRTADMATVRKLQKSSQLPIDSSVDSHEIHSELLTYPTAQISFRDESGMIRVLHQNLMWIEVPESGAKLYDIEGEDGKPHALVINSKLIVTPDQNGRLAVVQSADIETILRGIVPAEIFASAPEAALMAQAIAARTTLIGQVGTRHFADPWHLCNQQHCQVYRGLSGADSRTDKAIEKTRGQVMFSDKNLVQSYYSAHCGGMSAGSLETWGLPERSYLVSRSDDAQERGAFFSNDASFLTWWHDSSKDYCGSAPSGVKPFASTKHARWSKEVSISEIEKSLKKSGKSIGRIQEIQILERGESYRVTRLKLIGTEGKYEISRELPIRRFLGGLKSALFVMEVHKRGQFVESISLKGAGFGHGVGMCQTGAIGMAQRGKTAVEILQHYFPGSRIETLW